MGGDASSTSSGSISDKIEKLIEERAIKQVRKRKNKKRGRSRNRSRQSSKGSLASILSNYRAGSEGSSIEGNEDIDFLSTGPEPYFSEYDSDIKDDSVEATAGTTSFKRNKRKNLAGPVFVKTPSSSGIQNVKFSPTVEPQETNFVGFSFSTPSPSAKSQSANFGSHSPLLFPDIPNVDLSPQSTSEKFTDSPPFSLESIFPSIFTTNDENKNSDQRSVNQVTNHMHDSFGPTPKTAIFETSPETSLFPDIPSIDMSTRLKTQSSDISNQNNNDPINAFSSHIANNFGTNSHNNGGGFDTNSKDKDKKARFNPNAISSNFPSSNGNLQLINSNNAIGNSGGSFLTDSNGNIISNIISNNNNNNEQRFIISDTNNNPIHGITYTVTTARPQTFDSSNSRNNDIFNNNNGGTKRVVTVFTPDNSFSATTKPNTFSGNPNNGNNFGTSVSVEQNGNIFDQLRSFTGKNNNNNNNNNLNHFGNLPTITLGDAPVLIKRPSVMLTQNPIFPTNGNNLQPLVLNGEGAHHNNGGSINSFGSNHNFNGNNHNLGNQNGGFNSIQSNNNNQFNQNGNNFVSNIKNNNDPFNSNNLFTTNAQPTTSSHNLFRQDNGNGFTVTTAQPTIINNGGGTFVTTPSNNFPTSNQGDGSGFSVTTQQPNIDFSPNNQGGSGVFISTSEPNFNNQNTNNFGTTHTTATPFTPTTVATTPSHAGPPVTTSRPTNGYSPPRTPSTEYGAPTTPSSNYGTPATPSNDYGTPTTPSTNYGTPSSPLTKYGTPTTPSLEYGAPTTPSTKYGSPSTPSKKYGAPTTPSSEYGPPVTPSTAYGTPGTPSSTHFSTVNHNGNSFRSSSTTPTASKLTPVPVTSRPSAFKAPTQKNKIRPVTVPPFSSGQTVTAIAFGSKGRDGHISHDPESLSITALGHHKAPVFINSTIYLSTTPIPQILEAIGYVPRLRTPSSLPPRTRHRPPISHVTGPPSIHRKAPLHNPIIPFPSPPPAHFPSTIATTARTRVTPSRRLRTRTRTTLTPSTIGSTVASHRRRRPVSRTPTPVPPHSFHRPTPTSPVPLGRTPTTPFFQSTPSPRPTTPAGFLRSSPTPHGSPIPHLAGSTPFPPPFPHPTHGSRFPHNHGAHLPFINFGNPQHPHKSNVKGHSPSHKTNGGSSYSTVPSVPQEDDSSYTSFNNVQGRSPLSEPANLRTRSHGEPRKRAKQATTAQPDFSENLSTPKPRKKIKKIIKKKNKRPTATPSLPSGFIGSPHIVPGFNSIHPLANIDPGYHSSHGPPLFSGPPGGPFQYPPGLSPYDFGPSPLHGPPIGEGIPPPFIRGKKASVGSLGLAVEHVPGSPAYGSAFVGNPDSFYPPLPPSATFVGFSDVDRSFAEPGVRRRTKKKHKRRKGRGKLRRNNKRETSDD